MELIFYVDSPANCKQNGPKKAQDKNKNSLI